MRKHTCTDCAEKYGDLAERFPTLTTDEGKTCTMCREFKLYSEFTTCATYGYQARCTACIQDYALLNSERIQQRKIAAREADPETYQIKKVKRKYKLDPKDFTDLRDKFNDLCHICEENPWDSVDHDHACCPEKGKSCGECVRGLLCNTHNVLLGHLKDNIATIYNLISYLTSNFNWKIDRTRKIPTLNSKSRFPDIPFKRYSRVYPTPDKECGVCRRWFPVETFMERTGSTAKRDPHCDECRLERYQRRGLADKFGITLEEYNWMLEMQGGGCAGCGATANHSGNLLGVDHCHETDTIRGITCHNCNLAIEFCQESVEILEKAKLYLMNTTVKSTK